MQPYDPQNPENTQGQARNFKLHIPTLMWHKNPECCFGQTFYVDPAGWDLCYPSYMESKKNEDMNTPGMRYYHLWDTRPNTNGYPNRVGKVFPDYKMIIFDDDEIVAALNYKSNRNWTLPAPKLGLITPNTFSGVLGGTTGLLTGSSETLHLTYIFSNSAFTNSLHCNYYTTITGNDQSLLPGASDIIVRFGNEFPFLSEGALSGYSANSFKILCQIVSGDTQPTSTAWREIDFTSDISGTSINGYLTVSGLTGTTFQITNSLYSSASTYNLANYIDIPENGYPEILNFGDEYYFYGNLETDITATIYEMRYLINLGRNQFTNTSNPTWTSGTTSYVTEIGLYDSNYDLIVISKLQSPELRQGIQQYVVKLDF